MKEQGIFCFFGGVRMCVDGAFRVSGSGCGDEQGLESS